MGLGRCNASHNVCALMKVYVREAPSDGSQTLLVIRADPGTQRADEESQSSRLRVWPGLGFPRLIS
jgi:hypothetical protein